MLRRLPLPPFLALLLTVACAVPTPIDTDGDGIADEFDCAPSDPTVHPGAPEGCDGLDGNCDGAPGDEEVDHDGDGIPICAGDCALFDPVRYPGAPELCDDEDNDCDGELGADELDGDGDGSSVCEGDCDGEDPLRAPGVPELCNFVDDDCDGAIPEWEATKDEDGDGSLACDGEDCDDGDAAVHPGARDQCVPERDRNCDGVVDWDGSHAVPLAGTLTTDDAWATFEGDLDADGHMDTAFGRYVMGPGDVDGDGLGDVLVASMGDEPGLLYLAPFCHGTYGPKSADATLQCGSTDLFGNSKLGFVGDLNLDGLADLRVGPCIWYGPVAGEHGWQDADVFIAAGSLMSNRGPIQTVGDLDGNGFPDLVVSDFRGGESLSLPGGDFRYGPGRVAIFHGPLPSGEVSLEDADAIIEGEDWSDYAGYSVAAAGDVDGDGVEDLMVGAPWQEEGADSDNRYGRAYVMLGPFDGYRNLSEAYASWGGTEYYEQVGENVARVDGFSDWGESLVVVSSTGIYRVLAALAPGRHEVESVRPAAFVEHVGRSYGDSLVGADFDGDGQADLLVNAPTGGSTFLLSGAAVLPVDLAEAPTRIACDYPCELGPQVSLIGDTNADGADEFIVAVPRAANTVAGSALLMLGAVGASR